MGTNYYYNVEKEKNCECCGQKTLTTEKLHIGKSSAGWAFVVRVYPEKGIRCINDWIRLFLYSESWIEDEYGRFLTLEEMLSRIMQRRNDPLTEPSPGFLRESNATYGHNNLLYPRDAAYGGDPKATWCYDVREFC